MTALAAAATATYRIQSPGRGAYRVRLSERSGGSAAEAFMAGSGMDATVELPPGEYWAVVTDIGTGKATGRVAVTLSDTDQPVNLPDPLAPDGEMSAAPTPAVRRPSAGAIDRRPSNLPADESVLASRVVAPSRTSSGFPARRFDVSISEDRAPGSVGGWRKPAGLNVETDWGGASSGLRVRIRDDRHGRKSRVRMSIGLEGLPTIRVPLPLYRRGIEVAVHPSGDEDGNPDVRVEVTAADHRVQSLVTALTDLSSGEALSVLNWAAHGVDDMAIAILASKVNDLWAATVAALLLVKLGRTERVTQWLRNLARLAPHIADASIAAAWGSVADANLDIASAEKEAMDYLARAGRIGAPNYTVGNSLYLELLSSLHGTAADKKVCLAAEREYGKARKRSRFRLFKSPYMIWEEAGEKLQGGRLAGDHYLPVAHGTLTARSLALA